MTLGSSMDAQDQKEALEAGGLVDESSVTLAIYGQSLAPTDVAQILGVDATKAFEAGSKIGKRSPAIPHGAWLYELRGAAPIGPDELIARLISQLPGDGTIWSSLASRFKVQIRIAVHMEIWNRGFGLSPASLGWLAKTGAELVFDVYAYDRDA
jgi:Domain of unknown function (DUF4279)